MNNYSINVTWSVEDDCFVATIPEFSGLSAFGATREEAVAEAQIALEGFFEIYEENGISLPKPSTLPNYSGQFRLRLPKTLHSELSLEAHKEGCSLNSYISSLLSERHTLKQNNLQLQNTVNTLLEIIKKDQKATAYSQEIVDNYQQNRNQLVVITNTGANYDG